jgi:hypothetical protein
MRKIEHFGEDKWRCWMIFIVQKKEIAEAGLRTL